MAQTVIVLRDPMDRRTGVLIAHIALAALILIGTGRHAEAAISFGAGADYSSGPGTQSVRDALGYVQTSHGHADATVALARFNSSQAGVGTNAALALSWAASPKLSFQAVGSRAAGEADYRASRFQAGPVFPFHGGTLGVFYTRAEDTINPSSSGLSTELGLPLSPSVIATGRGGLASVEGGGTNLQGAAGLIWGASKRVLFVSEVGLGRDATALTSGAPAQGGFRISGRESGLGRAYLSGPALSIGMRYILR